MLLRVVERTWGASVRSTVRFLYNGLLERWIKTETDNLQSTPAYWPSVLRSTVDRISACPKEAMGLTYPDSRFLGKSLGGVFRLKLSPSKMRSLFCGGGAFIGCDKADMHCR
jgi:hypothetical protein